MNFSGLFDLDSDEFLDLFEITPIWKIFASIESFLFKQKFLGKKNSPIQEGVYLENENQIFIGSQVMIEPGAYIKGPCIIRDHCIIRHGSYIRGNVILGKQCIIGHGTEIKNSILLNRAKAAHFAYIGDSVLGNRVNIGAGVVCANFRFDEKNIKIESIDTGLNKLGSFIGDGVSVGCNTVLNPGTILGKRMIIFPCLNISGIFKEGSIIKSINEDDMKQEKSYELN